MKTSFNVEVAESGDRIKLEQWVKAYVAILLELDRKEQLAKAA